MHCSRRKTSSSRVDGAKRPPKKNSATAHLLVIAFGLLIHGDERHSGATSAFDIDMENSPLYRLPAEIRVMIYEYTLIRDQSLELLPASGSAAACQLTSPYCNVINISGTCRQIREESIAIFYKGNTFDIDLGTHLQAREDFDDRIWKVCT